MARKRRTEGRADQVTASPPPQLTFRKSIDRFKAARLVANILAHFPPNVRAAILQMALAGETDRQVELPVIKGEA